jgi:6-phosphogluconolactonase
MTETEWRAYDTTAEMADAVADEIGHLIESALEARDEAFIALPGGKTPIPIFERLAAKEIDWDRVTIIPTDDRVVPITDPLSNAATIAHHFLPKGARVLPIVAKETADYHTAGEAANAQLADLKWPPDLVWLGVGTDGHTASIFQGPDFEEAIGGPRRRRAIGVMPDPLPPEAPVPRVTLSRAAILSARMVMLTLSGFEKRAMVERALKDGPSSEAPIGRVLADARGPVEIHWSAR